ncbi:hypothetical protein CRUP_022153 [Coryphaenoides rupestris]|nr:hypothetical protein CRUP_022153 [Coryphaenoides rupestris]
MSADAFGAGGTDAQQTLQSFWPRVMEEIRNLTVKDFRVQELPLARIKKIMKLDEDVKMISAEAPVLFAKAAQIFITELTLRAWIHTEDNKRRTLQVRGGSCPARPPGPDCEGRGLSHLGVMRGKAEEVRQPVAPAEPVQYYFTLAQQPGTVQVQQQQGQQAGQATTTTLQPGQIIIAQPQQGQEEVRQPVAPAEPVQYYFTLAQQPGTVQVQQQQGQQAGQATTTTLQPGQIIIAQPQQGQVQLNTGQLQYIRLAQPVSGTQVVQGQIQTLGNAQQLSFALHLPPGP